MHKSKLRKNTTVTTQISEISRPLSWLLRGWTLIFLGNITLMISFTCEAHLLPLISSAARVAPVILLLKRDLICINKLISKRSQELYNSMCFAHIKPSNLIPYFKAEGLPGKNLRKNLKLTKRPQNNLEQHTSEFFTQWRRNIKKPCEITMWEITLTPLVDSKRFHSSPQP